MEKRTGYSSSVSPNEIYADCVNFLKKIFLFDWRKSFPVLLVTFTITLHEVVDAKTLNKTHKKLRDHVNKKKVLSYGLIKEGVNHPFRNAWEFFFHIFFYRFPLPFIFIYFFFLSIL